MLIIVPDAATGTSTLNQFTHEDQFSRHIIYVGSAFIPFALLFPVDRDQNFPSLPVWLAVN